MHRDNFLSRYVNTVHAIRKRAREATSVWKSESFRRISFTLLMHHVDEWKLSNALTFYFPTISMLGAHKCVRPVGRYRSLWNAVTITTLVTEVTGAATVCFILLTSSSKPSKELGAFSQGARNACGNCLLCFRLWLFHLVDKMVANLLFQNEPHGENPVRSRCTGSRVVWRTSEFLTQLGQKIRTAGWAMQGVYRALDVHLQTNSGDCEIFQNSKTNYSCNYLISISYSLW